MLEHIITGGNSGVEQAAWRVAKRWGHKTSGMMRKEFMTDCGQMSQFAELYSAKESRFSTRRSSVQTNVQNSNAVLWLGPKDCHGYNDVLNTCSHTSERCTERTEHSLSRRIITVEDMESRMRKHEAIGMIPIRDLLMTTKKVFITGPMESQEPGIGEMTERFLDTVFNMMKTKAAWDHWNQMAKKEKEENQEIEEPLEEDLEQLEQEHIEAGEQY